MTCGIILIQMIEKRYTVDILIHKKILPDKLIKANFNDFVTSRININFIQMFEINTHNSIKIFLKCFNRFCNMV